MATKRVLFEAGDDEEEEFYSTNIETDGGTPNDYIEYDDLLSTNVHF